MHRLPGREGANTLSYGVGLKTMHRPLGRQREDAHCPSAVPGSCCHDKFNDTEQSRGEKGLSLLTVYSPS